MSSTPDDGEVEQHAVEDESVLADLPDETTVAGEDYFGRREHGDGDEDIDTIPQLGQDPAGEPGVLQTAIQFAGTNPRPDSLDDSASIPDDTPSLQNSALSSPKSEHQLLQPPISRKGSTASRRPFELRFQSRLSGSYLNTPRAPSPAFLNVHSRNSSLASFGPPSDSAPDDTQAPWEVVRWTKLKRLTGQAFSEVGRRNFGNPTCLAVTDQIVVGTSKGLILVFDHHQTNKAIIGAGSKATEAGAITALAISADHTAIAAGHATGHIFTWELSRTTRPFMQISAIDATLAEARKGDGHIHGSAVVHIGFLGYRRTALVSADDRGMAFSHLASRGTGSIGRSVKTTRILGRYPELVVRTASKSVKKSSVLAFSPLPLGNVEQKTDSLGLVAILTPYLLVIVSTTPVAQTQHKFSRPKEVAAHSAMTAALAWFPAIKLKGSDSATSKNKLVYAWSNVLSVLDVEEAPRDADAPEDNPVELQFIPRSRYQAEEAIVAVQWLSRSVLAVLTITQQLLIIEDGSMNVTDSFDLLPKHIYHADLFSHQLQSVIEDHDEEDTSMHGVVADGYYMSFRCHKGRLFLLCASDIWWGSLTNWADRLIAMMETGDFIGAIRLATKYYSGSGEKVTIGLPEDDTLRSTLVREKLLEMISASLRYAFGKNEQASRAALETHQLTDLAVACVAACLKMDEKEFLFDEVFEWYDDNIAGDVFVDVLEPYILDREITTLPPAAVKTLITHFAKTHAPSHLEEIICLLDATVMDVDQVTTLCKRRNLYDAYIYVWNTALMDYTGPLLELLSMTSSAQNKRPGTNNTSNPFTSQKMFPYLSFVLTGRIYPLGEFMNEDRGLAAKLQIYETLFYGRAGQKNSFATLRSILEYDTPSLMAALNEAFEDPFLNNGQDEGLTEAGISNASSTSSLFNRQIIVRILLDVMSTGFEVNDHIYLDMFIARNLPKYPQYMLLAGTTVEQIFTRLCRYEDSEIHDDAQLSLEYLMTVYKPANIISFVPLLQEASFYRILKTVYRQEQDWIHLFQTFLIDSEDRLHVFDLIIEVLRQSASLERDQQVHFTQEVKRHIDELSAIEITRLAKTIDTVLPNEHSFFLENLADARLQFRYLRLLIQPGDGLVQSRNVTNTMIEQYVRLLCQFDAAHVADYISAIKEGDLRMDNVIPALESSGNIDAAVMLYAQQGQVKDAMSRLTKHLSALQSALVGVLDNAADSPDEVATNEAIEDLLISVDKYAKVGIWLCEGQTYNSTSSTKSISKSPKRSSTKQSLSFEEELWLEFIVAIVAIAQRVGPNAAQSTSGDDDELALALRNTIQRVFSSLLTSTTVARGQAQSDSLRFVRILRAFLSRAAETSPSLSHLRHVMKSIFSAYAYEESLLSLSNAMLDKDLFVHVDEVAKLRHMGWRPRGQVCGICRRRVWGPGSGLKVWESWQKAERNRIQQSDEHRRQSIANSHVEEEQEQRGKGKAAATDSPGGLEEDEEEQDRAVAALQPDLGPVIVFSCRHVFHKRCLDRSQDHSGDGNTSGNNNGAEDGLGGIRLACPICL